MRSKDIFPNRNQHFSCISINSYCVDYLQQVVARLRLKTLRYTLPNLKKKTKNHYCDHFTDFIVKYKSKLVTNLIGMKNKDSY